MEDLVESILDYVRSDYTDYAIMINGEWGVGKTHFWNNKVRKKIESMQLNGKRYTTIYRYCYMEQDYAKSNVSLWHETRSNQNVPARERAENKRVFRNYRVCNRTAQTNVGSGFENFQCRS